MSTPEATKEAIDKRIEQGNNEASIEQVHISKAEYETIVRERDVLKAQLSILGDQLNDNAFQAIDIINGIQRVGIGLRSLRLTNEQQVIKQNLLQQTQQRPQGQ